jgi:hypothetical protein
MISHGIDSSLILENISSRIQKLEQAIVEEGMGGEFQGSFMREPGSPGRARSTNVAKQRPLNRIRLLEEHIFELESQIKENETDIEQVKQNIMRQLRSRSESPRRGAEGREASPSSSDIKEIERKVKKLAESTTRACKSLSSGLTDVQQATLSLYSWTDRVHDGMEMVAQKLNLPSNLCPRAKLSSSGDRFKKIDYF